VSVDVCLRRHKAERRPLYGKRWAGETYCHHHDPARSEQRRRAASRAGRGRPSRELSGVKAQLQDLVRDVLAGDLETGRAAVANQLLNTRLRAVEIERKVKLDDELEARIEALEQGTGQRKAGRWGA
jgi:hypothetical protein